MSSKLHEFFMGLDSVADVASRMGRALPMNMFSTQVSIKRLAILLAVAKLMIFDEEHINMAWDSAVRRRSKGDQWAIRRFIKECLGKKAEAALAKLEKRGVGSERQTSGD